MEAYDPTGDIMRFRAFREPWVHVECTERLIDGLHVRTIAFNQRDGLVLIHVLPGGGAAYALSVFRSDSVEGELGELVTSYENIWHFDACS